MLSRDEVERYHEDGYLGPYRLCSAGEMAEIRGRLEREVFTNQTPVSGHYTYARHEDSALVYGLCSHPAIVERLTRLYGPDLLLWNSSFWIKGHDTLPVPWHQDLHYWRAALSVTAWLAITPTSVQNGCLHVIPGSHATVLPMIEAPDSVMFEKMTDPAYVDERARVPLELDAGEFVLFSDRLLHQSAVNESHEPRIGLVMRFTVPFVKLFQDRYPFFEGQRAFLVSGEDRFGLNRLGTAPVGP